MDLQFYGANCVTISSKRFRLVVDDNLAQIGGKTIIKDGDVAIETDSTLEVPEKAKPKLVISGPGEYEVLDVSINGIGAKSHMDESGENSTIYEVAYDDMSVLVVGHIYPDLSESQLEQIGEVDVMLVPVGGNGFTLDAAGALKLIKAIDPKLVIPTHYAGNGLKYEVPQQTLENALKELAMEPRETTSKLRLKSGELSDVTQLVVLETS